MDPILREMLKQAIEAAKEGDRNTALKLVEEVLKADEESVQAWILLARLAKKDSDKRDALLNALEFDPDNARAKEMLKAIEGEGPGEKKDELLPGISRNMVYIGAGVALTVLVFVIILLSLVGSNNARRAVAQQTEAFLPTLVVLEQTAFLVTQTQEAADATATFFAEVSPTPTPTVLSGLPTLPPSLTPTPTITPTPTLLPPPPFSGALVGARGRNAPNEDLELVRFISGQFEPQPLFSNQREGRQLQLFPSGNNYIYIEYNRDSFTDRIVNYNTFTGETTLISPILEDEPFDSAEMINLSQDGSFLTFVATPFGSSSAAVYLYSFQTERTVRMTFDDAVYSYPVIEPNNSRIAVVRQITTGENAGTDLVLIDIATTIPASLTTDRDNLIETYPRWSPDGLFVFYAARPQGSQTHNIYLVSPSNPGTGLLRIESPGNDILPIPDPTGQYLAFASNRDGRYNVYLFNLVTTEIVQQTIGGNIDEYPSDWR